jgi:hypothetical protein
MELPGSTYLLTLATVSITFVGFSSIAVVFRQAQGANLSEYEISLLRMFLLSGLIATIFSLIPPLLGLLGLAQLTIWRISSLTLAVVLLWRGIVFMRRQLSFRRQKLTYILFGITLLVFLGLSINVLGIFVEPSVGLYALGVTWYLVVALLAFMLSLQLFLHPPENG